jgi:hypothetical protein
VEIDMWSIECTAGALVALAAVAVARAAGAAEPRDPAARADLESLTHRSVVFGHQSVGMNLIVGLEELAAREGVPLRVLDVSGSPSAPPRTLAHLFVPENGKPEEKLVSFARAMTALPAPGPDIALVKFCYADFSPSTDSAALFDRYRKAISELQEARPGTRFVHVTTPLTTVQSGPKAWAKRILGRTPYGLVENARREEFNERMRRTYDGREPLLDLARVESTLPDGSRATLSWDGRTFPVLVEAYTDDGGHLNAEGRIRLAREFARLLASLPPR